jgi:hypothetical protein
MGTGTRRKTDAFGTVPYDRNIFVVYDDVDADTIYPVTAYEVPEP